MALKAWVDQGYSVRYVLTEALLAYHTSKGETDYRELSSKLDQVYKLLQQNGTRPLSLENDIGLSQNFLTTIRTVSKAR